MSAVTRLPEPRFDTPPASPQAWLHDWLAQALEAGQIEPTAMNLATVDAQGRPSNRTVLFKGFYETQLTFYTHYTGRKGEELGGNGAAALCFWWDRLDRQIRLEGEARPLPEAVSDAYFAGRGRGSRLGAWASEQSRPIESRTQMEDKLAAVEERFAEQEVPRPPHWGGFGLTPRLIEFWQGRDNRFHDRIVYTRTPAGDWTLSRLQP